MQIIALQIYNEMKMKMKNDNAEYKKQSVY